MTDTRKAAFDMENLVRKLLSAAMEPDAPTRIKALLEDAVADPGHVASNIPRLDEDDVILHEDDNVSIWHCRFQPGFAVPPHDH